MMKNTKIIEVAIFSILICVIVVSLIVRFVQAFKFGFYDGDALRYWNVSRLWAEGKFILDYPLPDANPHYYPTVYAVYALLHKLFGAGYYIVGVFNSSLEVLNVILVFAIGRITCKNNWVAILATVTYALLPRAFFYSVRGNMQIMLINFVLLSVLFISLYLKSGLKKHTYLFLSMFFVSLAANAHPTMATVLVSNCLLVLILHWALCSNLKQFFTEKSIIFLSSGGIFLSLYAAGLIKFRRWLIISHKIHYNRIHRLVDNYQIIDYGHGYENKGDFLYLFQCASHFLHQNVGYIFETTFYLSLLIGGYLFWKNRGSIKNIVMLYVPGVTVVTFVLMYATLIPRESIARLFLPFTALAMLHIFIVLIQFSKLCFPKYGTAVLFLFSILFITESSWNGRGISQISESKKIYDQLQGKIDFSADVLYVGSSDKRNMSHMRPYFTGKYTRLDMIEGRIDSVASVIGKLKPTYLQITFPEAPEEMKQYPAWGKIWKEALDIVEKNQENCEETTKFHGTFCLISPSEKQ